MTNPKNCGCGCVVKKKHWPVWSFCLLFICFLIELQLRWLFPIRTSDCAICSGHPTSSAENLFVFHGSTLPKTLGQLSLSSRFLGSKVGKTVADTVPKPLFWASEVSSSFLMIPLSNLQCWDGWGWGPWCLKNCSTWPKSVRGWCWPAVWSALFRKVSALQPLFWTVKTALCLWCVSVGNKQMSGEMATLHHETRCSPRTRMLTRMLMVQMSKHMEMQSRRTLFWNSLFEQSCTFSPVTIPVHLRLWNMEEGGVLSVECGV